MPPIAMLFISKVLGSLFTGQSITEHPMLRSLMRSVAVVIILATIIGMVVGTIFIGGFFGLYHLLIAQGLAAPAAITTLAFIVSLILISLIMFVSQYTRNLLKIDNSFQTASPVEEIVDAFIDGLLTHPPVRKSPPEGESL